MGQEGRGRTHTLDRGLVYLILSEIDVFSPKNNPITKFNYLANMNTKPPTKALLNLLASEKA